MTNESTNGNMFYLCKQHANYFSQSSPTLIKNFKYYQFHMVEIKRVIVFQVHSIVFIHEKYYQYISNELSSKYYNFITVSHFSPSKYTTSHKIHKEHDLICASTEVDKMTQQRKLNVCAHIVLQN